MALRSSSLTRKPRWPAEEGWPAAAGLPEGFQDAPRSLDANIFEAGFSSLVNCAAVGEGQAAAIPGVAARVDSPPAAIAADAVHAKLKLSNVSSTFIKAGAPAVPVAEVAAEVTVLPRAHQHPCRT